MDCSHRLPKSIRDMQRDGPASRPLVKCVSHPFRPALRRYIIPGCSRIHERCRGVAESPRRAPQDGSQPSRVQAKGAVCGIPAECSGTPQSLLLEAVPGHRDKRAGRKTAVDGGRGDAPRAAGRRPCQVLEQCELDVLSSPLVPCLIRNLGVRRT